MKKILSLVLAVALVLTLSCAALAEGYSGDLKVWVADAAVDFTNQQIEAFKAANPEFADMTVSVEAVGEGDAASKVITDVDAAADIFGFAQDQLARMVAAGAVEIVEPANAEVVKAENDAGAVAAVTMGDELYAYPLTSDNGYFLYYDKSVVTDPSTLEGILADCEAAGKSFYMEINSGWYQTAFFFGAGCTLTYDSDNDGNLTACNADYASENGLKALKSMIMLANSPAFVNGSSVSNATNAAAIVDGTWDSEAAKELFGDNYAAAKLPTVDGYQMSGFGGFKMQDAGREAPGGRGQAGRLRRAGRVAVLRRRAAGPLRGPGLGSLQPGGPAERRREGGRGPVRAGRSAAVHHPAGPVPRRLLEPCHRPGRQHHRPQVRRRR